MPQSHLLPEEAINLPNALILLLGASAEATAGDDAAAVRWMPFTDPGPLAFDHAAIVQAARPR